jgi:hypothetical protein
VEFDYPERYAEVTEVITYTNNAVDPLPELRLVVPPEEFPRLFSITGMWWVGGSSASRVVEGAAWEGEQMRIPLPEPLLPGDAIGMKLTYAFRLPSQPEVAGDRPMPIGYTSRQANLVDWYAFIPPYRSGTGWLAHPPAYYGEYQVYELSDFEVNLHLTGQPEGTVVAASALSRGDGEWLRYRLEGARSFALSIGSEYLVETEQVGNITVSSYYFLFHELAGKRALRTTVEALKLYQELFGPYPHTSLEVVEADFLDGMEYDGLYFLSKAFYNLHVGNDGDYLVAIAAHETAHQWWYGIVGSDQANEPWLDEALSTYCERLFYERYYPDALEWWWAYRVKGEGPGGWVDTSIYAPPGRVQTYLYYRNAVYLNGALFLEDLRTLVGDEAFFSFLKDYATRYSGKIASGEDFFALLAKHTQEDISPLLKQYFSGP